MPASIVPSLLAVATAALLGSTALADVFPRRGPFNVTSKTVHVPGLIDDGTAVVHLPQGSGPFPVVSFAHGWLAGGPVTTPVAYDPILTDVASHGYVVIAPESCVVAPCNGIFWKDQVRSIQWVAEQQATGDPDFRNASLARVGAFGHSMGGEAAVNVAKRQLGLSQIRLTATVSLHPAPSDPNTEGGVGVPILFISGADDVIVFPALVASEFGETQGRPKYYASQVGATHFEPTVLGPNRYNGVVAAFLKCYVSQDQQTCDLFDSQLCQLPNQWAKCEIQKNQTKAATTI